MTFLKLPSTRAEARVCGSPRYFTGKPCRRGHTAPRRTTDTVCIFCGQEKHKTNLESKLAYAKRYRETNSEKIKKSMQAYYKNNKHVFYSYNRLRRAQTRLAQPSWVNVKEVADFYQKAIELSSSRGIKYHVDHIIPLRGKNVCGLHVPWNLQVIPAKENLSKSNKLEQGVSP